MFRILKIRRRSKLRLESFGSRGATLGLLYGVLTVGRGAPFLLSALIILSNLRSILVSTVAMLVYSQLMVLPIGTTRFEALKANAKPPKIPA
jgi:hypothetical protein